MTIVICAAIVIIAMGAGFAFGRGYEREQWMPRPKVLDLHPSEWRRTS